jgi:UDP-GlcNAc:undecaprenyl-phosphate GlcNAc-1-phosphate transferase
MTTILVAFFLAAVLSNFLTPLAGKFGEKFGALDVPDERKVHSSAIPRTGGCAML